MDITVVKGSLTELIEVGERSSSADEERVEKVVGLARELLVEVGQDEVAEALREADLPAKCYAYVPDPEKPSTWKLRYLNADGSVDETHLAAAAAAFSPGGFRGQKVQIPAENVAAVKKKLVAAYHKLGKKDAEIPKQLLEAEPPGGSERLKLERVTPLRESAFVDENGMVKLQLIRAGWGNKRDNHYYPAKTLERDYKIFEGQKMYCDHPTALEEKQRPERSLRDWVATIKEVWAEDGIVWGKAKVHAQWFRELIAEAGEEIGVSLNALGDVRKGEIGGRRGGIVEALISGSADFVTQAGAGGRVAALYESARKEDATMFDTMTDEEILAGLKESRESVITAMKEELREEVRSDVKKEVEKELKEGGDPVDDKELTALKEANDKSAAEIEKLQRDLNVRDTREAVSEALEASKLPPISQQRIKEAFADKAFDSDEDRTKAIEEAIKAEREYVSKLTESGKVVGLGDGGTPIKEAQKDMDELLGVEPDKDEEDE